ncbi:MAG TPA: lamin tail domain-containing protein [Hanamia sp.]|nr:lamin tail domain-containing protein [Hanamia sp.]
MVKRILFFLYLLTLINKFGYSQISESFNDGDFINNPQWIGNSNAFVVNSSFQLQSNDTIANSSFYLATANTLATSVQWEFLVKINFNPSSANYIDAYLTSLSGDLNASSNQGYFVRIGNTEDEISLYRKDGSGVMTKIIDGENGILNHSSNTMKIKVIRDANNQWILYRDVSGTGNFYISEGSMMDDTYTTTSFFGFLIKQSTSGFFQKHFIDDIEIKNYLPDVTPPSIQSATAISSTTVDVLFDEPLDKASAGLFSNYSADKGLGMPMSVFADAQNPSLVHLTFENTFNNGEAYSLTINGVKDISGNAISNVIASFSFYIPQQYDIVIDEIMADPTPEVGLPNSEWVELKNTSGFPINLKGWRLNDLTGTSGPMADFVLQPDSFVIVCATSASTNLSSFGKIISVTGFPPLDNGGDLISIADANGKIIHAVQYSSDWYPNELKKDGGWSLEMIDTKNPCSGFSNWTASIDNSGGSPGRKNSVDGNNKDETSPELLRAFATNPTIITLLFNESVDSLKSAATENYVFDNGLSASSAITIPPLFDKIKITLNNPLTKGTVYQVTAKNISDCSGNNIGEKNLARFGLAQSADSSDLVINEVLFNPLPSGVDYVELYNRSQKIVDLSKVFIANRNSSNAISSIQQLSADNFLFFPGDFIVITIDPNVVKSQYITTNPDAFLKIKTMPSFSNDKGNVIILNEQGNTIDEVNYSDKWHFALIKNTEGVSLERIDYDATSIQNNFHSAATSAGYGTPGYKNSQYKINEDIMGEITITPEIFSPDNDGHEDFATINYRFPSPGYVANITIFDASGRPVRYLQKNSLSGITGYYRWDGLNDKNQKLPQGIYIIYTEIFNKEGKKKQFKNTIVLARRYN